MLNKLAFGLLAIGTIFWPVAVKAQERDSVHPLHFVADSAITINIKTKLADAKLDTLTHIKVDTDDHGVVVLSGHAKDRAQADMAVSIARRTDGVIDVLDRMKIAAD